MNRIIIADDSSTARMFTVRCLEVLGFKGIEIIECENGAEALLSLREGPTDLLITDLTMPIMDGTSLVKAIAGDERIKLKRIIVVTSAGNAAKEEELSEYGAKIIRKPISPAKLSEVLGGKQPDTWE